MQNKVKKSVWIVVAVVLGYFGLHYILIGPAVVPPEFQTARQKGASFAEEVAFLANKSLADLGEISKYDYEQNYSEALILVSRDLIQNRLLNDRAVQLSTELARMAERIPEIRPEKGREIASEAVGYEVALVSRLISYNNTLRELFEVLRGKFTGKIYDADGKVGQLISDINASAQAINGFNKAFSEALGRFDIVYK